MGEVMDQVMGLVMMPIILHHIACVVHDGRRTLESSYDGDSKV